VLCTRLTLFLIPSPRSHPNFAVGEPVSGIHHHGIRYRDPDLSSLWLLLTVLLGLYWTFLDLDDVNLTSRSLTTLPSARSLQVC
jgi:hypothetical protein